MIVNVVLYLCAFLYFLFRLVKIFDLCFQNLYIRKFLFVNFYSFELECNRIINRVVIYLNKVPLIKMYVSIVLFL